MNRKL